MKTKDNSNGGYEVLEVRNGSIFLDGKEIKNVTNFEMKVDAESIVAQIIIAKDVVLR